MDCEGLAVGSKDETLPRACPRYYPPCRRGVQAFLRRLEVSQRHSDRSKLSFAPWLYRVVVNTCQSIVRPQTSAFEKRRADWHLAEVMSMASSPEEYAWRAEISRGVCPETFPISSCRCSALLRELSEQEIAIGYRPSTGKNEIRCMTLDTGWLPTPSSGLDDRRYRPGGLPMTMIDEEALRDFHDVADSVPSIRS